MLGRRRGGTVQVRLHAADGQVHGILVIERLALNLTDRSASEFPGDVDAASHDLRIGQRFGHAVAGHPYLANAEIEYFVEDQVIHLEGFVPSRLAKQARWDLAWGCARSATSTRASRSTAVADLV